MEGSITRGVPQGCFRALLFPLYSSDSATVATHPCFSFTEGVQVIVDDRADWAGDLGKTTDWPVKWHIPLSEIVGHFLTQVPDGLPVAEHGTFPFY